MPIKRLLREPIRLGCTIGALPDRIASYGVESCEPLGRSRWVVNRALRWLHRFRRLRTRHDRRADMRQAFLSLARSLICSRYVEWFVRHSQRRKRTSSLTTGALPLGFFGFFGFLTI
jgi:hypothetical protein